MVRSVSNDKANDMAAIYSRVSWTIVKPADVRVEEVALEDIPMVMVISQDHVWGVQEDAYHSLLGLPLNWNHFRSHCDVAPMGVIFLGVARNNDG